MYDEVSHMVDENDYKVHTSVEGHIKGRIATGDLRNSGLGREEK